MTLTHNPFLYYSILEELYERSGSLPMPEYDLIFVLPYGIIPPQSGTPSWNTGPQVLDRVTEHLTWLDKEAMIEILPASLFGHGGGGRMLQIHPAFMGNAFA